MPTRKHLLVGLVTAALSFLLLAQWTQSGGAAPFDLGLRDIVHAYATPALTHVMVAITTLGAGYFLLPLGTIVAGILWGIGRQREAILLPAVSLSANLMSEMLKLALHRPRPAVFFGLPRADNYSFPSGHAFAATVFYGMLASILIGGESSFRKRAGIVAITLLAVLAIGLSRIYLGYHYPSDVLGGWACAAAWLALARLTLPRISQRGSSRGV